jgi:translation initiation factor IF-3
MFELTGTLKLKRDEQKVSDSFKKREFVVTDNSSNYPQHIQFQLTQDRCRLLDDMNAGDEVKVSFFIKGREWQSKEGAIKYFTSLDAWKIEKMAKGQQSQEPAASYNTSDNALQAADESDDLPF